MIDSATAEPIEFCKDHWAWFRTSKPSHLGSKFQTLMVSGKMAVYRLVEINSYPNRPDQYVFEFDHYRNPNEKQFYPTLK